MTLNEICSEIAELEQKMLWGEIEFSYDNLMSAMKPGHPAELLDEVLSEIGWDVFSNKPVSADRVSTWIKHLKSFKRAFKVKELSAPIKHAEQYLKEQEAKEDGD